MSIVNKFITWRNSRPSVPFFSSWFPTNRNWQAPEKPGPNATFKEKFWYEWALFFKPWF
jgi:hypothetical protein